MQKTPRERFKKVSIDRAEKIIMSIRSWGVTANHYTYEFERKEIDQIVNIIQRELDQVSTRFYNELDRKKGWRDEGCFKELRDNTK